MRAKEMTAVCAIRSDWGEDVYTVVHTEALIAAECPSNRIARTIQGF